MSRQGRGVYPGCLTFLLQLRETKLVIPQSTPSSSWRCPWSRPGTTRRTEGAGHICFERAAFQLVLSLLYRMPVKFSYLQWAIFLLVYLHKMPSSVFVCSARHSCLSPALHKVYACQICLSAEHGILACLQLCTWCLHVRFVCPQCTAFLLVCSSAQSVCMSDLSVCSARHSCLSAALHKVSACQICLSEVHGIPACLQLCTRCLS